MLDPDTGAAFYVFDLAVLDVIILFWVEIEDN